MKTQSLLFLFIIISFFCQAQSITPKVSQSFYHDVTPPLRDRKPIAPNGSHLEWKKKRQVVKQAFKDKHFNNKKNALPKNGDPVRQVIKNKSLNTSSPLVNFDGIVKEDNVVDNWLVPDPNGDAGPDHYFQITNAIFEIFDKSGNSVYGPADNETLFDGFIGEWSGEAGIDPIALYDGQAEKWFVAQWASVAILNDDGTFKETHDWTLIAVSTTSDPTGSWNRYAFQVERTPDYPKYGVWTDGYYSTVNHGNGATTVTVFDREAMINGASTAQTIEMYIPGPQLPGGGFIGMLPSDCDGDFPQLGSPNYFVYFNDDAWGDYPTDRLMIWEFETDWSDPSSSTFTLTHNLDTAPFDSDFGSLHAGRITQKDATQKLTAISAALMNRLQYRNFGTHETLVCNHTVDVNGNDHAGIRWYELRKDDDDWYIYQQGTYAPDEHNRWMGSIAMNSLGEIALGYSVSSSTLHPSLRCTGRKSCASLNQMSIPEITIFDGEHSQNTITRWGDYFSMTVDPVDDISFWFTGEYSNDPHWATRIACISYSSGCEDDIYLDDVFININESDNQQAASTITAQNYTIDGDGSSGGDVEFIAGCSILLSPEFISKIGSYFKASIDICTDHLLPEANNNKVTLHKNDSEIPERWDDDFYENKLIVSPNPASDFIKLSLTNVDKGEKYMISIFNVSGQLVYQKKCDYFVHTFDMNGLPSGQYYINANYKGKQWTEQIHLIK